jgi:hypothetical protein
MQHGQPDCLDDDTKVNAVTLQLLLQELVPTSMRVSQKLLETQDVEHIETRINHMLSTLKYDLPGTVCILDSDTINKDDVGLRLQLLGYNVGMKLCEILLYKSVPPSLTNVLEIMKFVCRDIWKCVFNKQMDNLRTNHRGTFVLIDNSHKLIVNNNSAKGIHDTIQKSKVYLWFSCGIIQGVLGNFGLESNVTAEITNFPTVTFNILTGINN